MQIFGIEHVFSLLCSVCSALSTFAKNKKRMFVFQIAGEGTNCLSNIFVDSPSGAVTALIACVRNILIFNSKWTKVACGICVTLCIAIGIISNQKGLIGLLPIIASSTYSVLLLFLHKAQHVRYAMLFTKSMWGIYYLYVGLYISSAMSFCVMFITIINIIRFWVSKKNTEQYEEG